MKYKVLTITDSGKGDDWLIEADSYGFNGGWLTFYKTVGEENAKIAIAVGSIREEDVEKIESE